MDPPPNFAAALIAALEEAQAAAGAARPEHELAASAWQKLQFDFPVVSAEELAALAGEYASGARRQVNPRFLAVLRENAAAAATAAPAGDQAPAAASSSSTQAEGAGSSSADAAAASPLAPLYQQLYAAAVVGALRAALEAAEPAAAAQLAAALPPAAPTASVLSAEGASQVEEALAQAAAGPADRSELEHRHSQQEDDDAFQYEPLDAPSGTLAAQYAAAPPAEAGPAAAPGGAEALPEQLARLAGNLSYHCMGDAGAWRQLGLLQRLAGCLAAARAHARWAELQGAAQPLLRLATDHLAAAPAELEAGLPTLLDALRIPGGSSGNGSSGAAALQDAAGAAAAGELALGAAVALAAQVAAPSARRQLWQVVHARLLPVAAQQLEQQQVALARQARAAAAGTGPTPEQLYAVMLPCQLLYFYVLQAPPAMLQPAPAAAGGKSGSGGSGGGSRLGDALLAAGLLRSLVLLFIQLGASPGAEPLRCALLLACAAAQPLADWAAAVPGFTAAAAAPGLGPGGEAALHGALWRVLLSGDGGDLAALLGGGAPAERVPALYQALQLMADVQAAARRPLWGAGVEAALRCLADELRREHGRAAAAAAEDGAAGAAGAAGDAAAAGGEEEEDPDAADARKLAVGAGEAAAAAAARRARALQPACLKLCKDLLQRQAGGGGSKHD